MKRKKRIKVKKKGLIIPLGIISIGLIIMLLFLIINEQNNLKNIKNYYNQYVLTTKKNIFI